MADERELRWARRAGSTAARIALRNPRVTLVDVGWKLRAGRPTGDLAVRVHVRRKPTGAAFERMARQRPDLVVDTGPIDFRTDIIEGVYRLDANGSAPADRLAAHRPVVGGVSIGNAWSARYGTLGGVVIDRVGDAMVLGNWHVLVGSAYARPGLAIYQPAYVDGWYRPHPIGALERDVLDAGYDAAVARLSPVIAWDNAQLELGPVAGAGMPVLGAAVHKSGRGSGLTSGVVDGIDGTFTYPYDGRRRTIVDVCRVVGTDDGARVSRDGDSGAWWLAADGTAVGLHFAGQPQPPIALAMSLPPVLVALGVALAED